MQDEHDQLAYVGGYEDQFIQCDSYKRHLRIQQKRDMERRREEILAKYLPDKPSKTKC